MQLVFLKHLFYLCDMELETINKNDRVWYNERLQATVIDTLGNYALILFDNGAKLCTNMNGLKLVK